jgi:hypothetical protein
LAFALGLPLVFGLPPALGLAAVGGFIAEIVGLAAADFRVGVATGFGVPVESGVAADLAVAPDLAAAVSGLPAVPDLAVPDLAVPDLAVPDLAGAAFGPAAAPSRDAGFALAVADLAAVFGAATDIDLTAAVSDLVAVVMALVALFIACMAVDIVFAEDVALVAAAVILVAAEVALVAADETFRTMDAAAGTFAEAWRVVLTAVARILAFVTGLRAARLDVLPLADLVPAALAGLRRAAVRVVVRAGTDLPPSRSITEVLFHGRRRFTPGRPLSPENNDPQAARK